MLNKDAFNDIATKISEALPEPARKMQAQFKQQAEKLSKAEAKLAELETRLAALEK